MNSSDLTPPLPTEALRRWLETQLGQGCAHADLLSAMGASGWSAADAAHALQTVAASLVPVAAVPAGLRVPEPQEGAAGASLNIDGRVVRVLMSMQHPRLIVFSGFLSDEECDALMQAAASRLSRSETVVDQDGGSEVNPARTSDGMFFQRGESPLITRIEARIAALLRWPVAWGEGLQVLRYRPGAQYRPHHDYFDPANPGTQAVLARGGQRVGTLLMYLNTPPAGGATVFPDVELELAAHRGHAVFFSYDRPHPVTRSLHGGSTVVNGEKWVATKWLREREFN